MNTKNQARLRRSKRTRKHIQKLGVHRLSVYRSLQYIYAQVLGVDGKVLASASTAEKELKKSFSNGANVKAATAVGELIAQRALAAGVKVIAFDRSGYKYHGRVKALADAARAAGLEF